MSLEPKMEVNAAPFEEPSGGDGNAALFEDAYLSPVQPKPQSTDVREWISSDPTGTESFLPPDGVPQLQNVPSDQTNLPTDQTSESTVGIDGTSQLPIDQTGTESTVGIDGTSQLPDGIYLVQNGTYQLLDVPSQVMDGTSQVPYGQPGTDSTLPTDDTPPSVLQPGGGVIGAGVERGHDAFNQQPSAIDGTSTVSDASVLRKDEPMITGGEIGQERLV